MSHISSEITIVGSGPAGVAAALRFADHRIKCLVLDVGYEAPRDSFPTENLYHLRSKNDVFWLMVGPNLERIRKLGKSANPVPAKLAAPHFDFVTRDATRLSPVEAHNFAPVQSFACGGLANAWGAGLYRYSSRELAGFPIGAVELQKYYDRLDEEIGISGTADDLAAFFGDGGFTQPPLRLSKKAHYLLERYELRRTRLNQLGMFMGRPRLGVLSHPKNGRTACTYSNLEFWVPRIPWIYVPSMTLERLSKAGAITYVNQVLVKSWTHLGDWIEVNIQHCGSGTLGSIRTRFLLLAAGPIGSAKLALSSRRDYRTSLPLLDNPTLQFPLFLPRFLGSPLEIDCFGLTQLNVVYDLGNGKVPLQGSILEVTSPARSEFFSAIPFAAKDSLTCIRYLVPSMLVLQLFLPGTQATAAKLSLSPTGRVVISGKENRADGEIVALVARTLRKLGAITHRRLVIAPPSGHGLHYAGTLPMANTPQSLYQCNKHCELDGDKRVFVIDGSVFPSLPPKNYSYTVMANAMRVADHVAKVLQGC